MALRNTLSDKIKEAMKARDADALDALRYLLSLVRNAEIDLKHELSDEELISLLQKEVKRRREAIEQFKSANRQELVDKEEKQLAILMQFLPKQLTQEEVEMKIKEIVAQSDVKEFPIVMKQAMAALKGQADGKLVSEIVKQILQA